MATTEHSSSTEPAEASAMLARPKRWSMMNLAGTSLAVPGPPCVMATTESKTFTTPANSSTKVVTSVGPSMGSTICRYTRQRGMPSMRAAFQISSSTPRKPASTSAITRPEACHTAAMTMV
jgi:hypothetical protein